MTEPMAALIEAAKQFRFYETEHRKKGTPESDRKAEVNAKFAVMCEGAIDQRGAFIALRAAFIAGAAFGGAISVEASEAADDYAACALDPRSSAPSIGEKQ